MALPNSYIAEAIDTAPLNRGLVGTNWLANPANIPITFENGDIALFDYEGDSAYQIHLLFQSRGRKAIEHLKEALKIMLTERGATLIFALVPDFRRDVKMISRWAGGYSAGMRDTQDGPCELFVLSKAQWKVTNS